MSQTTRLPLLKKEESDRLLNLVAELCPGWQQRLQHAHRLHVTGRPDDVARMLTGSLGSLLRLGGACSYVRVQPCTAVFFSDMLSNT